MLMQLSMPLNFIGFSIAKSGRALTDIEQMFKLLERKPEIVDRPGATAAAVAQGVRRFEDVHFAYDPARQILKGISFEVPAGKTVAIVGPSGAGKSTISRLLFRFYDVQGGRILIDGQDIARRHAGEPARGDRHGAAGYRAVQRHHRLQHPLRPPRTPRPRRSSAAADLAQIGPFIAACRRATRRMVGERGLKLSGGEKQRVAIARTILKAPPILFSTRRRRRSTPIPSRKSRTALDMCQPRPHDARHRPPAVDRHRRRRDHRARGRPDRRARHPSSLLAAGGLYASMWNRQREATEARETLKRARERRALRIAVPAI